MLTRRRDFTVAIAGASLFFAGRRTVWAASDFWNKKDKAEWSGEEVHSLTTKSPWAKDARVEFRRGLRPNFDGTPGGLAMPNDPSRSVPGSQDGVRMNVPMGRDGVGAPEGPRSGGAGVVPLESTAVTVRWESAQPVLDAMKIAASGDFAEHYVIGVAGLTALAAQRAITLEHLRMSASLQAKGKSPAQPGMTRYGKDKSVILFGFSKEFLTLTVTDRNVDFLIDTGDIQIRARFEPKDMLYHGQLAV